MGKQDTEAQKTDEIESIDSPTRTFRKSLPCLNLYIAVVYRVDEPERIDYIKIHGTNKTTDCGHSFLESMSDMLTFSIRRIRNRNEAILICKSLRDHNCNRQQPNREGIKSCVDAIGRVIQEALGISESELRGRA
jgi:hypothetical protein